MDFRRDVLLCRGVAAGFKLFRCCGRWPWGGGAKLDEFVDLSVVAVEGHCIASWWRFSISYLRPKQIIASRVLIPVYHGKSKVHCLTG